MIKFDCKNCDCYSLDNIPVSLSSIILFNMQSMDSEVGKESVKEEDDKKYQ